MPLKRLSVTEAERALGLWHSRSLWFSGDLISLHTIEITEMTGRFMPIFFKHWKSEWLLNHEKTTTQPTSKQKSNKKTPPNQNRTNQKKIKTKPAKQTKKTNHDNKKANPSTNQVMILSTDSGEDRNKWTDVGQARKKSRQMSECSRCSDDHKCREQLFYVLFISVPFFRTVKLGDLRCLLS